MMDTINYALDLYSDNIEFDVDAGDDSFDYEYGSIRGTHGGKYCNVECGGEDLTLTVTAHEDDEFTDDLVGTEGTHTVECDSGCGSTTVSVKFSYTVVSVDPAARTIEIEFDFWGSAEYESDGDYDYDDYDGCAHDGYCY